MVGAAVHLDGDPAIGIAQIEPRSAAGQSYLDIAGRLGQACCAQQGKTVAFEFAPGPSAHVRKRRPYRRMATECQQAGGEPIRSCEPLLHRGRDEWSAAFDDGALQPVHRDIAAERFEPGLSESRAVHDQAGLATYSPVGGHRDVYRQQRRVPQTVPRQCCGVAEYRTAAGI